jgi:hypothetical protein
MAMRSNYPNLPKLKKLKAQRPSIHRCLMLFAILFCGFAQARAQDVDYSVHANIIYHFTKYIDWPEQKKTGNFVIGVVGDSPLYDELKSSIANKKVRDQAIVIKRISASSAVFNCHILFISDDESSSFKKIASATKGSSVLLVSESEGLARKGSCINFIIVNERLKLEINKENIEERHLNIASELLKLGILVNK